MKNKYYKLFNIFFIIISISNFRPLNIQLLSPLLASMEVNNEFFIDYQLSLFEFHFDNGEFLTINNYSDISKEDCIRQNHLLISVNYLNTTHSNLIFDSNLYNYTFKISRILENDQLRVYTNDMKFLGNLLFLLYEEPILNEPFIAFTNGTEVLQLVCKENSTNKYGFETKIGLLNFLRCESVIQYQASVFFESDKLFIFSMIANYPESFLRMIFENVTYLNGNFEIIDTNIDFIPFKISFTQYIPFIVGIIIFIVSITMGFLWKNRNKLRKKDNMVKIF